MGSRIMHLIIADKVSKRLEMSDTPEVLLGGIAPDAVFGRARKDASHFFGGDLDDGTRFVDYHAFKEKHLQALEEAFGLGYFIHLIADDVWLKRIYFKNDLKKRVDQDPSLLDRWHSDFRKLNGRLLEQYGASDLLENLVDATLLESPIDKIDMGDLRQFKEEALRDFNYPKDELVRELEVYSWNEILLYIEEAAEKAIEECTLLLKGSARL
ncbi:hydrolase [Planococcus ruber]|uniref:hydrolase n=1 Tax=Planococcus ruber TaxID=2027871 RepID=UPI001FEE61CC|nr:hydrolase [Planococcus ruber]MCJ1909197.1 hydrolase [Planococcus ruber]